MQSTKMQSANMQSANMNTANMQDTIDYQFAARYLAICEKICAYQGSWLNYIVPSCNPLITMAYVNKHPEKHWCWQALTSNPAISIAYMEQHPEQPWQPDEYHLRKYGGEAEVFECQDLVDEDAITDNNISPSEWHCKNVTLDIIEKNMNKIDALTALGYNEAEETDLGYIVWHHIAENPNLTLEFLEKYYQKPWGDILFLNPLTKAKAQFTRDCLRAVSILDKYE